jgi:hypothetical protein
MKKFIFKCQLCKTVMIIETELPEKVHMVPPCLCGKSRMHWLGSDEYKYGVYKPDVNTLIEYQEFFEE